MLFAAGKESTTTYDVGAKGKGELEIEETKTSKANPSGHLKTMSVFVFYLVTVTALLIAFLAILWVY